MNDIVRPVTDDGQIGYDEYDQFIWKRPQGEYTVMSPICDVREETCEICERGWEPTGPSIGDQHHSQLYGWVHLTCLVRLGALKEKARFWHALCGTVRFRGLKPIENRYWPKGDPYAKKPWYTAELIDHPARFVVGSRKRVCQIEVVAEGGKELEHWKRAEEAFADKDVTKSFGPSRCYIHTWNEEEDTRTIKLMAESLGFAIVREGSNGHNEG
jgi:hypothetical protein